MKKVITALDNSEINEEMKTDYDIVCKDISYKEGIIEQIESNKKVDIIIFDERLDGNIELADLIRKIKEKIKKIEIIIITSNKNKVIQKTKRYKRIKIYETNKIKIKKLKEIIDEENQEKKEKKIEIKKNKNILTISGSEGVGKTVISIIISKLLKKDNLLID